MQKDANENVLSSEESVLRRWREELMNEGNDRERRLDEADIVNQEMRDITKDQVQKALKRMKNRKAVEAWRCLGEMRRESNLTRVCLTRAEDAEIFCWD